MVIVLEKKRVGFMFLSSRGLSSGTSITQLQYSFRGLAPSLVNPMVKNRVFLCHFDPVQHIRRTTGTGKRNENPNIFQIIFKYPDGIRSIGKNTFDSENQKLLAKYSAIMEKNPYHR
mgnify:CR=1 FL=1